MFTNNKTETDIQSNINNNDHFKKKIILTIIFIIILIFLYYLYKYYKKNNKTKSNNDSLKEYDSLLLKKMELQYNKQKLKLQNKNNPDPAIQQELENIKNQKNKIDQIIQYIEPSLYQYHQNNKIHLIDSKIDDLIKKYQYNKRELESNYDGASRDIEIKQKKFENFQQSWQPSQYGIGLLTALSEHIKNCIDNRNQIQNQIDILNAQFQKDLEKLKKKKEIRENKIKSMSK